MNFRFPVLALVLISSGVGDLQAQTTIWNGAGDGVTWGSSANWSNGAPSSAYTAEFNSSAAPTLGGTSSTLSSLLLNSGTFALGSTGGNLTVSSDLVDTSSGNAAISAGILGSGSLFIEGGATLTLNAGGASTYSGGTYLYSTGGVLADGAANAYSPNSIINLAATGTVDVNFNESIAGITDYNAGQGFVVLASGVTLTMNSSFLTNFSGVISGPGNIVKDGSSTMILTGANTYTGTTTIGSGATIQVGNGSAAGSIASSGVSGAGSLSFDLTNTYSYPGVLSGALGVVQGGTGVVALSGTNTYSGSTTVNNGTLRAASTSAFGGATGLSAVSVAAGATLDLNGNSNTVGSLAGASTSSVTLGSGTLTVAGPSANTVFAGTISDGGSGGSLKMSSYVLEVTGGNTYTGGTTITSGTLLADNASGSATGTGPISVTGGALQLGNGDASGYVSPTAAITVSGTGTVSLFRTDSISFANNIGGTGGVGQYGTGTVTLTGTNTYSGNTTVFRGTLKAGSSSAFGGAAGLSEIYMPNSGTLDLNGFDNTVGSIYGIAGNSILLGSNTLTVAGTSGSQTFAGVISGAGGHLVVTGSGATTVLDGANTYTGGTTIGPGASLSVGDGTATGASIATNVTDNGSLTFAPASTENRTYSGVISGGGSVNIAGANNSGNLGIMALSGANTYTGGTDVTSGEVFIGTSTAGLPGAITSGPFGTGTLTFENGTEVSPTANVTIANNIVLNGGGYIDNDDGGTNNLTLTGQISGNNGIAWCTDGTLTLTGNNTFLGGIDSRPVTGGTILLGSNTAAGTGLIYLENGSTLGVFGTNSSITIANDIQVSGTATFGTGSLDNNSLTITGPISGTGNVTYSGGSAGTLKLTGANGGLSSGTFTITGGTLIAGNNNALGSSADTVSLTGGATLNVQGGITISNPLSFSGSANVLSGGGTIASPAITANGAVVLSPSASPGNGPGDLSFTNPLTLASGGAIHFDLYDANGTPGTGFSEISANGGLSLTASANTITFNIVTVNSSGNPTTAVNFNPANSYSWLFASSSAAITGFSAGEFNIITSGFANNFAGGGFSISENGDNLYLNFTPVPEPSTWAMMGAGILALAASALRRRRASRA